MSRTLRLKATGAVLCRFTNSPITRDQDRNHLAGAYRKAGFPGSAQLKEHDASLGHRH